MRKTAMLASALLITLASTGQPAYDLLLKSRALNEGKRPAEAISVLSGAVNELDDYRLYLELADSKILTGDYEGAVEDLNRSNKIMPYSGEYGLAKIYALRKDAAVSVSHLENTMNSAFKRSEKEILLDPAFSRIENRSEWRQFWKKDWYTDIEKGISEIEYYLSAGKPDEARLIQSGLERDYNDKNDLIFSSALIDYLSGRPQEAIKKLTRLTALDPENGKYLELLAKTQTALSNYAGASETYSRLIRIQIPSAGFFLQRAECYYRTGELNRSIDDIEKYLRIYPEDKKGLSMAGKVTAASGDNLKALEFFSENIRLHPADAGCFQDRANAHLSSKSWSWAISDYSMSLDLNPENSDVWLNKGVALVSTGNTKDACHDFMQAYKLGNKRSTEYISRYCIK